MARTPSTMLSLGTQAPSFSLPDTDGNEVSLRDLQGNPLLIIFLCNHCPFVKHIADELAALTTEYADKGIAVVGINSNDIERFPEDGLIEMKQEKKSRQYTFSYLLDDSQEVAKAYRAACTPDFFLFNKSHKLVYRGQFDESRPGNGIAVTGNDLRRAMDEVLEGRPVFADQQPSIGCNIKWKEGNAPDYF